MGEPDVIWIVRVPGYVIGSLAGVLSAVPINVGLIDAFGRPESAVADYALYLMCFLPGLIVFRYVASAGWPVSMPWRTALAIFVLSQVAVQIGNGLASLHDVLPESGLAVLIQLCILLAWAEGFVMVVRSQVRLRHG